MVASPFNFLGQQIDELTLALTNGLNGMDARVTALEEENAKLREFIKVDTPNVGDLTIITPASDIILDPGGTGEVIVEGDVMAMNDLTVMELTELEGEVMAMQGATIIGDLDAEDTTIDGTLNMIGLTESGSFYIVSTTITGYTSGDLLTVACNAGDVAVGGGAIFDAPQNFRTRGFSPTDLLPEEYGVRITGVTSTQASMIALCVQVIV